MKKLIWLTILAALLLIAVNARAEVSVSLSYPHYLSEDMGTPNAPSPKLTLGTKNLYAWASYENADMETQAHNQLGEIELIGAGVGVKLKVGLFAELGYYHPIAEAEGSYEWKEAYWEAIGETLVVRLHPLEVPAKQCKWENDPLYWPTYSYKIAGGIGGSLGFEQRIGDNLKVFASYRFLKLDEKYKGYNCAYSLDDGFLKLDEKYKGYNCAYSLDDGYGFWLIEDTRDLSCVMVGVGVVW
jgi:hypothetical protein